MRKTKKVLSLVLVSAMAASLAACGGGNTADPTTAAAGSSAAETTTAGDAAEDETTAAGAAEESGEFNIAVCLASEPQTIDPALNSAVDGAIMINHMFEGLIKWVDDGEGNATLAPGQAESWEKVVNDDGTVTYTMKMRDGIKWSDGKDVTAGDFEYSWKRLATPETAADYCYMIDMVQGYADVASGEAEPDTLGIKAVDDKTLEIVLSYDCPYFEEIMAFPATFPVRKDMVEGNDEWTYDPASYVGNGPYKMKEWSHNAYILAEKNTEYYDYANLGPETIRFTLLDDANAMLAATRAASCSSSRRFPQTRSQTIWLPARWISRTTSELTTYASTRRTRFSLIPRSARPSLWPLTVTIL